MLQQDSQTHILGSGRHLGNRPSKQKLKEQTEVLVHRKENSERPRGSTTPRPAQGFTWELSNDSWAWQPRGAH